MYVRKGDVVTDLETGNEYSVKRTTDERGTDSYAVVYNRQGGRYPLNLGEGYPTEDEARGALDELLSAAEITPHMVQPPSTAEEREGVDRGENVGKTPVEKN